MLKIRVLIAVAFLGIILAPLLIRAQGPGDGFIIIQRDLPKGWDPIELNPVLVVQRTTDSLVLIQIDSDKGLLRYALMNGEYDQLRAGVYPPSYEYYHNLENSYQIKLVSGEALELMVLFVADVAGLDYISRRVDSMAFTIQDSAGTLVVTPFDDSAKSIPVAELMLLPDLCWCFQDTVHHQKKSIQQVWAQIDPDVAVPYLLEAGYYAGISGKVMIKRIGRRKSARAFNETSLGTLFCFRVKSEEASTLIANILHECLYSGD